jgi:hypothetical protein
MENQKPDVFPSEEVIKQANETGTKIAEQFEKENNVTHVHKTQGELEAEAKMKADSLALLEEQLRKRDELIAQRKAEKEGNKVEENPYAPQTPPVTYATIENNVEHGKLEVPEDKYKHLSTPQEDAPFDVIKLPSEGLLYPNHGTSVKVAYLNAMDENIITNPNLLKTGKFLEILINRKVMDKNLRYKDLHVGDRNAIMLWLRSTGYGPMYKIRLGDPENNYEEFEAEIDLSKLPIKNLKEKPDANGHFTFKLPLSQKEIKFKLLTVGDVEEIETHVEEMAKELGPEFTDTSTYTLKKQIISVDGNSNSKDVETFIERGMRIGDVRAFRQYVNDLESGVDMNITVGTPGGGSVATFLPINTSFFWPDLGI